jgi:hypothetical protein
VVEEREKGGPFSSLDDFRGRVPLPSEELATLVRVGAFDFTGKGREVLLKEAGVARLGHLPPWWTARHAPEPFPLDDLLPYAPLLGQWQAEWELQRNKGGSPRGVVEPFTGAAIARPCRLTRL